MSVDRSGDELPWLDAGGGYQLALLGRAIRARNARGRVLASLPAALRHSPLLERLRRLQEWLERHEQECTATVERWMLRSLPVPPAVVEAVWPDPAWQAPLRDAVVVTLDASGAPEPGGAGLLRAADPERGLGIVALDGETRWLRPAACAVPHPALLPDLAEFRDFAGELDIDQGIAQLFRDTWDRSTGLDPDGTAVEAFAGGQFNAGRQAVLRCRELGYAVTGGCAVTRIWEGGQLVEARFEIGDGSPDYGTSTGSLLWLGPASERLRLGDVGPVAFSEGMRMAAAIHGGRGEQAGVD